MQIKKLITLLLLIEILLSIIIQIISIEMIETVLAFITIVLIVFLFHLVSKMTIIISAFFLLFGMKLYLETENSWTTIVNEFIGIGNVITFLAIVPLLTILIECFPIDKNQIQQLAQRNFYANSQTFTAMLSSGLNLGGIPIVYSSFHPFLYDKNKELLIQSISRGFSLTMAWSPIGVGLAIVVDLFGLRLIEMILMMLIVSIGLMYLDQTITMRATKFKVDWSLILKLLQSNRRLFFWLGIFPAVIIVINSMFHISPVFLLTSCMLPYLFLIGFLHHKQALVWNRVKNHFQTNLLTMSNHFLIILSSSFFVRIISIPSNHTRLNHFLTTISSSVFTDYLFLIMMLAMILLSIVGIHIFVLYSLFITVFPPTFFEINSYLYAFEMLMLLIIITMISPYNGTNAIISSITMKKNTHLVKMNIPYSVGLLLFAWSIFLILSP